MLKNIFFAGCLLVTSMASQAGLISYNGYERAESSDIVKGGGLQWLKWDVTKGMSINEARSIYGAAGWELATNEQVTTLFNAFKFGNKLWTNTEGVTQQAGGGWTKDENSPQNAFSSLFGFTYSLMCATNTQTSCYEPNDALFQTAAWFGNDPDGDGLYKEAFIRGDASLRNNNGTYSKMTDFYYMTNDSVGINRKSSSYGVALVRLTPEPAQPVSAPASFSLLTLGLIALGFRRRPVLIH